MNSEAPKPKTTSMTRCARNAFLGLAWLLLITKLFFFDFDRYIIQHWWHDGDWILRHPLISFLAVISIIWIFLGSGRLTALLIDFAILPAKFLLWKPALLLGRNWPIVIAFVPAIHELLVGFKWTFATYVFAALAGIVVLSSTHPVPVAISGWYLILFLMMHFVTAMRRCYRANAFEGLSRAARKVSEYVENGFIDDPPKPVSKAPEKEEQKAAQHAIAINPEATKLNNLRAFYAGSQFIDYVSDELESVAKSRKPELFLLFLVVYTFMLTTGVFALIYLAISDLDKNAFSVNKETPLVAFLGLSLRRMTVSGVSTIQAVSSWAIWAEHTQSIFQITLLTLGIFMLLTTRRQRYLENVHEFIQELRSIKASIDRRLIAAFSLTIVIVEQQLLESDASFINWIRRKRGLPELSVPKGGSIDSELTATPVPERVEAEKHELEYGIQSSRVGFVYPPGAPQKYTSLVDVSDFKRGAKVRDPRSSKVFLVP